MNVSGLFRNRNTKRFLQSIPYCLTLRLRGRRSRHGRLALRSTSFAIRRGSRLLWRAWRCGEINDLWCLRGSSTRSSTSPLTEPLSVLSGWRRSWRSQLAFAGFLAGETFRFELLPVQALQALIDRSGARRLLSIGSCIGWRSGWSFTRVAVRCSGRHCLIFGSAIELTQ